MHKFFMVFSSFKKNKKNTFFFNSTNQIFSIGSLDAGFQQVPFVQIFINFHNIIMENKSFKVIEEKQIIISYKIFPKDQFTIEIDLFSAVKLILR